MDSGVQIISNRQQFVIIYNDVMDSGKLTLEELALFVILMRFEGTCPQTIISTIAEKFGVSEEKINKLMASLEEKGVLVKYNQYDDNTGAVKTIQVLQDDPEDWKK